ncbi:hypothetical protein DDW13_08005 [Acidianus hospitalis]|uniref:Uncharacterized protein n=1 Tax=Acidianus hospitalis TaxID=563177 RepID=A0A2T9X2M3_9CREN|nr:hypothetical protein DDW13_08005 [Acidianus hospitalis]
MIPLGGPTPTVESMVEKMRGTLAGVEVSHGIASPIRQELTFVEGNATILQSLAEEIINKSLIILYKNINYKKEIFRSENN